MIPQKSSPKVWFLKIEIFKTFVIKIMNIKV